MPFQRERHEPTTDELFAMVTREITQAREEFDRRPMVRRTSDAGLDRAVQAQFECLSQLTLILVKLERRLTNIGR